MSPSGDPADKKNVQYAALGTQALTVGGEVGCLTLMIVLGAVIGGLWLDRLLGTKPLFTVFLVLASAPLALGLTIWIAKRAVNPIKKSNAVSGGPEPSEGDKTGE